MRTVGTAGGKPSDAPWPALALLAATAFLLMAWIVWRAFIPLEIDRNEPWNAWHARDVAEGTALYPTADELIGNNYPPLSFLALGGMARLGADPLLAGRLVSLASLAAASLAVFACLRALGAGSPCALGAGLWYIAMMARFQARYVGMDDPNLAALAIMGAGVAWILNSQPRGTVPYAGFALLIVGGFVKHNLIALPLVMLAWQARVQPRSRVRILAFCTVMVGAGLFACRYAYGPEFLQQLTAPRRYVPLRAVSSLGWLLQNLAPALLVWAAWIAGRAATQYDSPPCCWA